MSEFDPEAFTAIARDRLYTDDELAVANVWAHDLVAADPVMRQDHPLVVFCANWTKLSYPTKMYSANFKKLNAVILPYVIKLVGIDKPKA